MIQICQRSQYLSKAKQKQNTISRKFCNFVFLLLPENKLILSEASSKQKKYLDSHHWQGGGGENLCGGSKTWFKGLSSAVHIYSNQTCHGKKNSHIKLNM
jgi:hypothetical protein